MGVRMEGMEEGPPRGKEPQDACLRPDSEHAAPPPGV